jgi:hypothetical protein
VYVVDGRLHGPQVAGCNLDYLETGIDPALACSRDKSQQHVSM